MVTPFLEDGALLVSYLSVTEAFLLQNTIEATLYLLESEGPADRGSSRPAGGLEEPPSIADHLTAALAERDGARRPADPALIRMFPDACADQAVAAEFRAMTQPELRRTKADRLDRMLVSLNGGNQVDQKLTTGPVAFEVSAGEAQGFAAAMTDMRLVIAEHLGVSADSDVEAVYERVQAVVEASTQDEAYEVMWLDAERLAFVVLANLQGNLIEALWDLPHGALN
ncbi:DUF2017 family protein [Rarobacter incanus]|uniref:Uncharacterized protein DUF2017 n=1 Tax=Rarobacter incanus TaxID=153494 RepID=A0A542SRQ8_9MICO|nr:DUF2017 family protein [Rarobacter incanus]TQK77292.1 uncharacterized protein DUF2017 [Rarobacter incanus]